MIDWKSQILILAVPRIYKCKCSVTKNVFARKNITDITLATAKQVHSATLKLHHSIQ
ncbi:hypothetical protein [Candidatus Uabimicrobium sp. HlEnr_7]|uniref:hypothetical protein n=1 Tax=Candidatus Uabimicrobium helgolandensis TaxID=3095367 RepID=UPI003556CC7A